MATTPSPARRRTADEVNEEIRALWLGAGGRLRPDERRVYEQLVTEWAEAEADASPTHAA
ncbi:MULTISPECIES: hypothetical protein [Streptomyces]|uniref:DUF2934 domain-containing protein n=1 Tax=Streptomyces huasconensis TaxID=1854574 RepID=A0ABV3LWH5_9ACTN|nr:MULTISPECIES: hypothetical protein [Streptomyces]UFQ16973.1 hypothetical protein J2N69_19295 [Streptomyces huasconensis]WCL86575.1 hypothetical protein PPN52_19300 [Streptomyces sp. JCM 35825]